MMTRRRRCATGTAGPAAAERRAATFSPAMRAIDDADPGGAWEAKERRLRGSEDEYVVMLSGTLVAVAGAGDTWTVERSNLYPHDREYLVVDIIQLRDGRAYRETTDWAEPFRRRSGDARGWSWTRRPR